MTPTRPYTFLMSGTTGVWTRVRVETVKIGVKDVDMRPLVTYPKLWAGTRTATDTFQTEHHPGVP